jgi:hypothetical protein
MENTALTQSQTMPLCYRLNVSESLNHDASIKIIGWQICADAVEKLISIR